MVIGTYISLVYIFSICVFNDCYCGRRGFMSLLFLTPPRKKKFRTVDGEKFIVMYPKIHFHWLTFYCRTRCVRTRTNMGILHVPTIILLSVRFIRQPLCWLYCIISINIQTIIISNSFFRQFHWKLFINLWGFLIFFYENLLTMPENNIRLSKD